MSKSSINMKITIEVEGTEGLSAVLEYKETTIETVKLVENAILSALVSINK